MKTSSKKTFSMLSVLAVTAVSMSFSTPVLANSTPNSYTVKGSSWIDVPEADRVYFEDFGQGNQDDTNIYHIPSGVSCTINGVTATGPFLAGDDRTEPSESECTKDGSAFDPVNTSGGNRVGAHPIGFDINFFGTTYSDLYFSENGGVYFDNPTSDYDESLTKLAVEAETSLIAPWAIDMYYDADEGSFYTAQTTVDGKDAFVISWMQMDECCDGNTPDDASYSFQFVFLNDGSGDFTAYFNYDELVNAKQGYDAVIDIDMLNGVTVGSNIVTGSTVNGLTDGVCTQVSDNNYGSGSLTDSSWDNGANYVKLHSASSKQISVWQDSSCTVANNISAVQDLANDGITYVSLEFGSVDSAAVGWGTFDSTDQSVSVTELYANEAHTKLVDGGGTELIAVSINTTVPGRIVLGQVGGQTTGDPNDPNSTPIFNVAPTPYLGPVLQSTYVLSKVREGEDVTLPGSAMGSIVSASVDGISVQVLSVSDTALRIRIPALTAGVKNILITWSGGQLLHINAFEVLEPLPADPQKVNAGSFKGFIAVYTLGFDGSRLSAKIGEDWLIVDSLDGRYVRTIERVRWVGHEITVRIYIDRVLMRTVELTTR